MTKYSVYIKSLEWRKKSLEFLKNTGSRCQLTGRKISFHDGVYSPYAVHHFSYSSLGTEVWPWDVAVLSREAHQFIHGALAFSGTPLRVSEQNMNDWNKYPNLPQSLAHCFCIVVGIFLYLLRTRRKIIK